jgi:conjugal transfer/entry exclusion protein
MDREILSIIMLVIFLLLVGLVIYLNNTNKVDSAIKQRIWADLLQVKAMVETKNSLIYRDILIRLDSLLGKAFKLYYKNSESCGTNLKQARDLFNKEEYDKIWKIHKLRNQVVHENKEISSSELMESYSIIGSAIKKLLYEK